MLCANERTSVADGVGLRRQLDGLLAGDTAAGQIGELLGGTGGVEVVEQGRGAAHVEVGVVLPGDGDAAMDLGVEVGAQIGGRRGQRRGHRGGIGELVPAGRRGPGSVPHGTRRQLGGDRHVGAVVLHRLVHGDRAPELDALLGVLGPHLRALPGDADRVGRQDHPGQVGEHSTGTWASR